VLKKVHDSRSGTYMGKGAQKELAIVQAIMGPQDGYIYRLRECDTCERRAATTEMVFVVGGALLKAPRIPNPPLLDAKRATQQGYTGQPCSRCQSLRTVRSGTCVNCLDCLHSGECG